MTHAVLYQLIHVGPSCTFFRFGDHHGTPWLCIGMSGPMAPSRMILAVETTGASFPVDLTTRLLQILVFAV